MHHIIRDFRTKNQTLWPGVWVLRVRNLPKLGFTNLTIGRDLYAHLTEAARAHGSPSIPSYLGGLSRKPGKKMVVAHYGQMESKTRFLSRWKVAGRVGFEPTI